MSGLSVEQLTQKAREFLPSRHYLYAVIAIAGMQFLATMDGTIAVVTLPKIQAELHLNDATRSWVITAYMLSFGGLMLLGGRLGDTFGRKRVFIGGITLFTLASIGVGLAQEDIGLAIFRLIQGVGAAVASPTALALIATTFPKGPLRTAAVAVFGAMTGVGSIAGLIVGGALAEVSWRLAFLINVPAGALMIYLAVRSLTETEREPMKLDVAGSVLATLGCTAAVFGFTQGPDRGWDSPYTIVSLIAATALLIAFLLVERTAENPVVPFSLFADRNRVATFAAIFLAGGVLFTLTITIGLYMQDLMKYSPLRTGISAIPFVVGMGIGLGVSSQLVTRLAPRVLILCGGVVVFGAMIYGSTIDRTIAYFPDFATAIFVGGLGIGTIVVPVVLSAITGVDADRIGPLSAISLMLQNLGGPIVLVIIQAIITSRTLYLGGATGPVQNMNRDQLHALDHGYTYGMLWIAGTAVLVGVAALFITYSAADVAHAQKAQAAHDQGLDEDELE
ncbi:MFS transporter [Mycobacteroides abscessus subsp. abscessus]|uniref:MFS transporter n=1 Tax=Mycobacteroides abscessus TaxID=36809 RepID=UPI00266CD5C8|nr:MFS transporter [Mycobacteroides abscessus]MDO3168028.1 MFS transporter [Mycobacteroides abscessus subsp. abscessus]